MHWTDAAAGDEFVRSEVSGAEFGDRRLAQRFEAIAAAAIAMPASSYPKMTASDAALEGTYRFLNNDRVTPEAILAPHVRATCARVAAAGRVIVAHDSTEFSFGPIPRGDLDRVGKGKSYGFNAHVSLAVSADDSRVPLGVLAVKTYNRSFGSPRLKEGRNKKKADNTMLRWGEQVELVRQRIQGSANVVHVMDREADDYALFAAMVAADDRFVIRQATNRRTKRNAPEPKVRDVLERAPVIATREVELSARRKSAKKGHPGRHPLRAERSTRFEIRAVRVKFQRPKSAGDGVAEHLDLNLVEAVERNAPAGQEPVSWWLWTNEPIDTAEDVLAVIDAYRARWCVEEYFKALKSGCCIEERQLESQHALLNALAVFVPVAWRLLLIRSLSRHAPEAAASVVLTPLQERALRGYMLKRLKIRLPQHLKARDVLLAVARLGGHITNNGEPGWIVLGRGLDRLLDVESGLILALEDEM